MNVEYLFVLSEITLYFVPSGFLTQWFNTMKYTGSGLEAVDTELLRTICNTPGAPGYEKPIRDFVFNQVKNLADEVEVDPMGNIIVLKKGKKENKRVMAAAHMDEIGFMVTHIDDNGFVRFVPLGGFDPKTLTSQRVIIHGKKDVLGVMGSKPIHLMEAEERTKAVKIEDFFIDTGLDKETMDKLVKPGDPVTRERDLVIMGNCINAKSLDNRISVYILIEALRLLQRRDIPYHFYGVFTVQEEVGLRGVQSAAHRINPDFGFGLDTTIAFDVPGAKAHEYVTRLGKGVGIKVLDSSVICDYRMVNFMRTLADKHDITWQTEILPRGGTDTAGIQRFGKMGAIAGAISIPTRHIHQVIEMVHQSDVVAAVHLLCESISNLDTYNWSH